MILLTGATGMAGSHIVNAFVRAREPVRVLVRDRAKAAWLEHHPTVEIVEGDIADHSQLLPALEGIERALLLSGPTPDLVETQGRFVDTASAAGVRHVVKFSGLDARPETTFPFGRLHRQAEQHLEASGLAWTHFRPTGFMEEYLREAPSIVHQQALFLPLGDVRLNPVDLTDIGQVVFKLLKGGGREGEVITMTGPEALSMADIAERISRASGREVRYVAISREQRRQALIEHGVPAAIADALDAQVHERLKGGLESEVDLSAHRAFDVRPTTFLEFAQRNAEAFHGRAAA